MSFCTLTFPYFCVSTLFDPDPNFTKRNPPVVIITRIILKIVLFTALNRGPQYISSIRKRLHNTLVQ